MNENSVSLLELATGIKVYDYDLPFSIVGSFMISQTGTDVIICDKDKATM